jgi:hypothetical protein
MSLIRVHLRYGPILRPHFFYGASSGNVDVQAPLIAEDVLRVLQGNQGLPGATGAGVNFVQSTAASVWTINHNLGYRPSVEVFSAAGEEVEPEITHPTVNQTVINCTPPLAGSARLN